MWLWGNLDRSGVVDEVRRMYAGNLRRGGMDLSKLPKDVVGLVSNVGFGRERLVSESEGDESQKTNEVRPLSRVTRNRGLRMRPHLPVGHK